MYLLHLFRSPQKCKPRQPLQPSVKYPCHIQNASARLALLHNTSGEMWVQTAEKCCSDKTAHKANIPCSTSAGTLKGNCGKRSPPTSLGGRVGEKNVTTPAERLYLSQDCGVSCGNEECVLHVQERVLAEQVGHKQIPHGVQNHRQWNVSR